jgi:hypothetical protein
VSGKQNKENREEKEGMGSKANRKYEEGKKRRWI